MALQQLSPYLFGFVLETCYEFPVYKCENMKIASHSVLRKKPVILRSSPKDTVL